MYKTTLIEIKNLTLVRAKGVFRTMLLIYEKILIIKVGGE